MQHDDTPIEEWFSSGDRMLDPLEASTERYLRSRAMVAPDGSRYYYPKAVAR